MGFLEENEMRDERGRLRPGHSGLKQKGATGRLPQEIKKRITEFLSGELETLDEVYTQVSPKEKLKFLTELMSYVLPKSKEILLETEKRPEASMDFEKVSTETLKQLAELQAKIRTEIEQFDKDYGTTTENH